MFFGQLFFSFMFNMVKVNKVQTCFYDFEFMNCFITWLVTVRRVVLRKTTLECNFQCFQWENKFYQLYFQHFMYILNEAQNHMRSWTYNTYVPVICFFLVVEVLHFTCHYSSDWFVVILLSNYHSKIRYCCQSAANFQISNYKFMVCYLLKSERFTNVKS